jgi:hypothetical protein
MVTRTVTGEDDYGDDILSESTQTVRARVDRKRTPQHVAERSGEYVDADVEILVSDEHDVSDTPPETLFRVDGVEYEVIRADDQDGGLVVADCKRRT